MQINRAKIPPTLDGEIRLPDCPIFRKEAEEVLTLLIKIPPFPYKNKEEFTRRVVVEYWDYYESLETNLRAYPQLSRKVAFGDWFVKKATDADHIQRAVRWLTSEGYVILDKEVAERAKKRGETIRSTAGTRGE